MFSLNGEQLLNGDFFFFFLEFLNHFLMVKYVNTNERIFNSVDESGFLYMIIRVSYIRGAMNTDREYVNLIKSF